MGVFNVYRCWAFTFTFADSSSISSILYSTHFLDNVVGAWFELSLIEFPNEIREKTENWHQENYREEEGAFKDQSARLERNEHKTHKEGREEGSEHEICEIICEEDDFCGHGQENDKVEEISRKNEIKCLLSSGEDNWRVVDE